MADEIFKIEKIRFVYQKARHHRTFHADGMWASVTPQLEVQFALFSNLKPMPQEVVHKVEAGGVLGEETERESEQIVIREVDATIVMSKETIKGSIDLLNRMLKEIDKHIEFLRKDKEDAKRKAEEQDDATKAQ